MRTSGVEFSGRRNRLICLIVALAIASVAYRILFLTGTEQTALLFIGLPTFLALLLASVPPTRSVTGSILKGMTLFFLMLGILAIEGFICIAMAAPLFFVIGLLIGVPIDVSRRRKEEEKRKRMKANHIIVGLLVLLSLEGVHHISSFSRDEVVVRELIVAKDAEAVRELLAVGPVALVNADLPVFLKMGFPRPLTVQGGGLNLGDRWEIVFEGKEGTPGKLSAELIENTNNRFRWAMVSDSSPIAHWLTWKDATWSIEELAPSRTQIRLVVRYERELDPAWYFAPSERYAVGLAAELLLEESMGDGGEQQ